MRAIVFAAEDSRGMEPLSAHRPASLLRIVDKPFLFHLFEALHTQGIQKVELVVHDFPEQLRAAVGQGERWGLQVSIHTIKHPSTPFSTLRFNAERWEENWIFLAHASELPLGKVELLNQPTRLFAQQFPTEWGIVSRKSLCQLRGTESWKEVLDLQNSPHPIHVEHLLKLRTHRDLVESNQWALEYGSDFLLFPSSARQLRPGVWVSRGCKIHPSVELQAPLFLGEGVEVKEGAQLGPHSLLEGHSLVDSYAHVGQSLVCQNSYIGEGLDVQESIVDRNVLIHLTLGTQVVIKDDFLLGELSPPSLSRSFFHFLERAFAGMLLILLSPLILSFVLFRRLKVESKVRLPSSPHKSEWEEDPLLSFSTQAPCGTVFHLLSQLPRLYNILCGQIHFIGVQPRSRVELEQLPPDWQGLVLKAKAGMIAVSDVEYGPHASSDEVYSSESYYSAHRGVWTDCKIACSYLAQSIRFRKRESSRESQIPSSAVKEETHS